MNNAGDDQEGTDYGPLTQRQAENIADLAAKRAQQRMYAEIGRNVVSKALLVGGTCLVAAAAWVNGWLGGAPK